MSSELVKRKNFWSNNQLQRCEFYQDNKREGESKAWYKNGQLQWYRFYKDGKLEGENKEWHGMKMETVIGIVIVKII